MELGGQRITADFSITKGHILQHQEFTRGDLPMAALAVGNTMTEDRMEALMIGTISAEHPEEKEDGKPLKTGIRYAEAVTSSLL